jgi:putative SOS response-associated peptidase YedK
VTEQTGEIAHSFGILTTAADWSPPLSAFPAYASGKTWLDLHTPIREITPMMAPFPAEYLRAYPVSPSLKSSNREMRLPRWVGSLVFAEYYCEVYEDIKPIGMNNCQTK